MSTSRKKPLSLDAAVNVLAFAFDEPVKSGICASRMRVAAVRVEDELVVRESMSDKVKFAKSVPKLRSSIRLLTRKQPRAEYVAMIDHVLRCRCNRNDPKIRAPHHPGLHPPDGSIRSEDMLSLRTTVQIIVQLLRFALSGMTKNKFRSLEDTALASPVKPWPYDANDLLPNGLEDSIAALTLWEAQAGGFHIFRVATALGKFHPPFADALVRDPKYEFVLVRPLSMVDQVLGWFEANPAKYSTREGNADNIVCDPIDIAFDLWFGLFSTVLFIRGIIALSSAVIPVMERLQRVLPSLPATDFWKGQMKAGCELVLSMAKGDVANLQAAVPAPASEHELIKDALQEMTWARKGGCYHVDCQQSLDTAYARLCSRCDVLRYCGEENPTENPRQNPTLTSPNIHLKLLKCRKAAWKMKGHPHKALCKRIYALKEQIGTHSWPALWDEGMTLRKLLDLPKAKPLDLDNLQSINSELEILRTWKAKFRTSAGMATLTKNPLSLDAAVDILAATFQDPLKSRICASRLHVASDRINGELRKRELTSEKAKFTKSQPKLLRASIKFLTLKQTPIEYMVMINHLMRCSCNFKDPEIRDLHTPGQHVPDGKIHPDDMNSLRLAVRTVVECISLALSAMTKSKFRSLEESSTQIGHVKPWPLDVDDLLPSGIPDSINTLTLWAAEAGGFAIFRLATALAQFYQPFLDALFRAPEYDLALRQPTKEIAATLDWFEKDPDRYRVEQDLITTPLNVIFDYLVVILPTSQFHQMVKDLSSTVIPVFKRLQRLLPSIPGPESWKSNINVGCEIVLSIAKDDVDDLQSRAAALDLEHADPVRDALSEMFTTRRGGCAYVFCPRVHDTAYARLCSKCDLVRFCGPECQKAAWKTQLFPHKALCSKIHALKEQLGRDVWTLLWTEELTTDEFRQLSMTMLLDLSNFQTIGKELNALKMLRFETRRLGVF